MHVLWRGTSRPAVFFGKNERNAEDGAWLMGAEISRRRRASFVCGEAIVKQPEFVLYNY